MNRISNTAWSEMSVIHSVCVCRKGRSLPCVLKNWLDAKHLQSDYDHPGPIIFMSTLRWHYWYDYLLEYVMYDNGSLGLSISMKHSFRSSISDSKVWLDSSICVWRRYVSQSMYSSKKMIVKYIVGFYISALSCWWIFRDDFYRTSTYYISLMHYSCKSNTSVK